MHRGHLQGRALSIECREAGPSCPASPISFHQGSFASCTDASGRPIGMENASPVRRRHLSSSVHPRQREGCHVDNWVVTGADGFGRLRVVVVRTLGFVIAASTAKEPVTSVKPPSSSDTELVRLCPAGGVRVLQLPRPGGQRGKGGEPPCARPLVPIDADNETDGADGDGAGLWPADRPSSVSPAGFGTRPARRWTATAVPPPRGSRPVRAAA